MPTSLTGSSQPIQLGGGYALRAPGLRGTADMRAPGNAPTRADVRGLDTGLAALDDALQRAHVTEVRRIDLTVQPAGPGGPGAAGAPGGAAPSLRAVDGTPQLELEVPDLGPALGQLVLSIDDAGALRWHLPVDEDPDTAGRGVDTPQGMPNDPSVVGATASAAGGPASRGGGAVKRFRLPAALVPPPPDAAGVRQRSLLGTAARRLLKVLVYPVTDPILGPVSNAFARHWEEKKRPYRLRAFTPSDYRTGDVTAIDPAAAEAMTSAGPVLLFIHGTFSTSHGGFGGLPEAAMATLSQRYGGRVLAFDHPTMHDDPTENVRQLLAAWPLGRSDVDVVCHSRGGLVSRVLAQASPDVRVRRLVFGAAPNAGTALTDPDHMVDMVDRLTTALSLAPTGPVTETLEALVTLLKMVGHGALKGLSGLASMNPQGEFLQRMNAAGAAPGARTAPEYFAISADYQPIDRGLRALVSGAADNVADQVFGQAGNDLVVPADGVWARNGAGGFPLPEDHVLRFGHPDGVMHTTVFDQQKTAEKLLAWLA